MASSARLDELKKKFDENPRRYFAPLANEHRKSGDLDQAIALCRTHLPQQPAHISGHIVLAQALFEAGSLDESREIFHTALGLDPENLIALRYLGDIARESADVSTARSWYQRVLEVDPRNDEIVQLVRELDAPPPVVEAPAPEPVAEAPAAPATAAPSSDNDERFAPLSLESVDFDAALDSAEPPRPESSPAASDETLDVHASWNPAEPTVELPLMDTPEIDPFDLNPAASAESLFDASTEAPVEDLFMTELAELNAPTDGTGVDPEYSVADAWATAPEPEPAVHRDVSEPATASFEEGEFYIEPAADGVSHAAEAAAPNVDAPVAHQPADEMPSWDLPEAEAPQTVAPVAEAQSDSIPSIDAFEPAAQDESVDEHVQAFAEAPTAEWKSPAATEPPSVEAYADNGLGLEPMEFVPPSSGEVTREPELIVDEFTSAGMASDATSMSQAATPGSFVTETMAELYLQQGFRNEALAVYRELLARNPTDASLRDRIDQIESGSISSIGIAAVSEDVVESALRRQSARPARSVRSFFSSLASRRAPYQPQAETTEPVSDVDDAAPNDPVAIAAEPALAAEVPPIEALQPEVAAPPVSPILSAAETLASYDPFADVPELVSPSAPEVTDELPNVEPPVLQAPEPVSASVEPSTHEPTAASRSLEDLFPDTPVAPRSEVAAQTLATAFGRQEPQGRPTRAASSELSLDKVFRGSPEGVAPSDGGFSFDQFFSDARPAGSDVAAPTMSPPETGRSGGGAGDAHDIEQFTAWLEGLKKK
jgi:tetratricopeptide (TPR) repeat protein